MLHKSIVNAQSNMSIDYDYDYNNDPESLRKYRVGTCFSVFLVLSQQLSSYNRFCKPFASEDDYGQSEFIPPKEEEDW